MQFMRSQSRDAVVLGNVSLSGRNLGLALSSAPRAGGLGGESVHLFGFF